MAKVAVSQRREHACVTRNDLSQLVHTSAGSAEKGADPASSLQAADPPPVTAGITAVKSSMPFPSGNGQGKWKSANRAEDVLRLGLPENRRVAKSWLQFLIQAGRLDDAERAWDWIVGRGYADNALAGEYADFLIRRGHPDLAASACAQHMGARAEDHDKSTYLFNGDFESDPAQSPFDWSVGRTDGVEVARDCTAAHSGECSLRISFAGTQNLNFAAASQLAREARSLYPRADPH